jgi:ABC-type multidrug transport system ATPase subunit
VFKERALDWGALRARMTAVIEAFGIKATGPEALARTLSGGNQQKLVVARALQGSPALIVAENPARGLDVGAAREVFRRLRDAAAAGAAVVFHSTDLDEVMDEADRIVVMNGGRVIVPPAGADRLAIVDENGTYIGEEYSLVLAAKLIMSKKPGSMTAANLSTSRMLDDVAAQHGGKVLRTPVGEANVIQAMLIMIHMCQLQQ